MTKIELVKKISEETGLDHTEVLTVVESFMSNMKKTVASGESVYLRGFATFGPKHRASKMGRNITKNTTIEVPAHDVPSMKPCVEWMEMMRK